MADSTANLFATLLVAIVLFGTGLLLLWLAGRSANDRLPRNQLAGIRTALTLSSDDAWYAAQRAGAGATRVAAIGVLVGSAVTAVLALVFPSGVTLSIVALATAAWLLVWALVGAARGQRAARALTPDF